MGHSIQNYQLHWLIACLLLALGSQASFSQCAPPPTTSGKILNYSFQPLLADGKMTLHVTLEFKGGREGQAELELPSEWAGQTHLEKAVTDLKAVSDETTISDTASPSDKNLRFPPNATVRISYVLVKDWAGPLNSGTRFRTVLEPEYFQVTSNAALGSTGVRNLLTFCSSFTLSYGTQSSTRAVLWAGLSQARGRRSYSIRD